MTWNDSGPPILTPTDFATVRAAMKPGDLIAFGGEGVISRMIRLVTRCPVSHVGLILRVRDEHGVLRVELMESTSLHGKAGVQRTHLSERLESYDGVLWWLPLAKRYRHALNLDAYVTLLEQVEGRGYDFRQIAHFWWDRLNLWARGEDSSRLFCSELAALALKAGGALPASLNTSEVRPSDLVRYRIWATHYYQLCGTTHPIPRYNSVPVPLPASWGEP